MDIKCKFGECEEFYTGQDCVKCGRNRVMKYSKGYEICEKCLWCEQLKRYVDEDEFIEEDPYWWKGDWEKDGEKK